MKKTNLLLILSFLLLLGCEETKTKETYITVENTTEIFTPKENKQQKLNYTKEKKQNNHTKKPTNKNLKKTFTLNTSKENNFVLHIDNKHISVDTIQTPLILISLFNTKSNQNSTELPYLLRLKNKYKKQLTVLTILVDQEEKNKVLQAYPELSDIYYFFTHKEEMTQFMQTIKKILEIKEKLTLPLSILYKNGNYYIHYEGSTPIEMLEHNIHQAIHQGK